MTSGATGTTGTPPTADKKDFTLKDINIMLFMFLRMVIGDIGLHSQLTRRI